MAKPTKKSNRINETIILLIVLLSAILLIANTGQQIVDELDTQADTGTVNQSEVMPTPTVLPTATNPADATTVPAGPTATPTPIKIFG